MSELRWILLAAAVLVIAYVYWRGRADQRRGERSGDARIEPVVRTSDLTLDPPVGAERREPALGAMDDIVDENESAARVGAPAPLRPAATPTRGPAPAERSGADRGPQGAPARAAASDGGPQARPEPGRKIVALRIARRSGERIPGVLLLDVLHREGLQFGEYRIFHRYADPADRNVRSPLFSVASMVEPGEIDPELAEATELAGLAMFMVLPGPKAGPSALTEMLGTARRIAAALGAELFDQHGSTMTRQTADHLRDEIVEFEHRHRAEHQAGALDR